MVHSATRLFAATLFIAALALRLIYLWEHRASPFFDAPILDAKTFLDKAQLIADGDLWGGSEPFWQPPLYIYLLAAVCWLFPISHFVAIHFLHATLGALSCVIVYVLVRRTFGEQVGRIAGGITALCGSLIYFEGELLAVPLEVILNLLLLHRLSLALRQQRNRDWILAGLIVGLAALTRPNVLLFATVFCAWLIWQRDDVNRISRRAFLSFLLTAALVICPITLRNWIAEPDLVLISSNGGVNFYIGNNADYEHTVSLRPGMDWDEMVMEPGRAGQQTAAAKSAYFLRKSLSYIAAHPLDYLGLLLDKSLAFWLGPEAKRNQNIYYARQDSRVLSALLWDWHLSFPFGLLGPLSLLGLGLSIRERDPSIVILRLYALSYIASVVLFFPAARYRMPVLPVLIAFAAFAAWCLYLSIRRKSWARAAGQIAPLSVLLILCNLTAASPPITEDAQLHFDLGEVHLRKENYAIAERYSRRALALDPNYNYARHNLAVAHFYQGHYSASEREALATVAENPLRPDTHVLLGQIYLQTKKLRQAEIHLQRALTIDPASTMAHYYTGRLLYRQQRYAAAATHLQQVLTKQPNDFWLRYELARALQQAGQNTAALHHYQQALTLSRRPEALVAIGALHLLEGRAREARTHFIQALDVDPYNPEAHINLALLDLEDGRPAIAIDRLRQVLARGNSPQAQRLLDEIRRRMSNN
ncbi:MAG: tetratricopeptide repeat protein [Candidatus Latescibacterota bacterium]|jgi:tetratricopeptide (TPR) repeat protein